MAAAAEDLDLSVLPTEYRVAFEALQATAVRAAELEDIVKRLEHLVAELNHVVHGKKSEKLSEDDRQLAFEDLETAVAEVEEQKSSHSGASLLVLEDGKATPLHDRPAAHLSAGSRGDRIPRNP